MGTATQTSSTMGRGTAGKKKEKKDLNELKQELEIDVHKVSVDELLKRFNTQVERGLTASQAEKNLAEYGRNELTPPPTTPEWVKFCQNLFRIRLFAVAWSYSLLPGLRYPGICIRGAPR